MFYHDTISRGVLCSTYAGEPPSKELDLAMGAIYKSGYHYKCQSCSAPLPKHYELVECEYCGSNQF